MRTQHAGMFAMVFLVAGCGSGEGPAGGSGNGGSGGSVSGGGGTGASSSGGSSAGGSGGTSVGGGGTGGAPSGGGSSSGGFGNGGGGPVIEGGPCVDPIATPSSPPCADGSPAQNYCRASDPSDLVMATCPSGGETQCEAAVACGSGWHFCNGSEYLDRGGRTIPKGDGIIYAWIAACVRDKSNQLTDGPCSVCDTEVGLPPGMIYYCDGSSVGPGMIDDTIGAMADTECHRIGENIPAAAGYWAINWSGHLSAYTLCCVDGA